MDAHVLVIGLNFLEQGLYTLISISAIVGAVFAATTRPDAFDAGDRQSKWVWVGLLFGSAVAVFFQLPFLAWIGMVIIGVYWFDVRPHLKDLVDGRYNAW